LTSFKISVDISDAIKKLERVDISRTIIEEIQSGGEQIMSDAKNSVHVVSGELKASGSTHKTQDGIEGGFSKEYATFEENRSGGRYPGSHAYLEPAVERNGPIIAKNIERALKEAFG
jgi:hypothetical protein